MKIYYMEICKNRHTIPEAVDGAVFPHQVQYPFDKKALRRIMEKRLEGVEALYLYITGPETLMWLILNHCKKHHVQCVAWQWNGKRFYPRAYRPGNV